jgi:hypothetical protein
VRTRFFVRRKGLLERHHPGGLIALAQAIRSPARQARLSRLTRHSLGPGQRCRKAVRQVTLEFTAMDVAARRPDIDPQTPE